MEASPSPLSSRPERTRISCHAAPDKTAYAPFFKERRMMLANATNFYRKSGAAQWRDLCVDAPSWKCFFRPECSAVERSAVLTRLSPATTNSGPLYPKAIPPHSQLKYSAPDW
jgi:hypothetical protein